MAHPLQQFVDTLVIKSDVDGVRELVTTTDPPEGLDVRQRPQGSTDLGHPVTGGRTYFPALMGSFHSWFIPAGYEAVFELGGTNVTVPSPEG